ncbi:MarR family transcriptional regulator [Streptomyces rectiverticillatus]|uniref:MarR family transcriptional regulator n=1 Tax=Streptomyces rectiverticillatus TaxID=173860 RepID=UPI0015C31408|nr:MarR family transcriptional regulator [Streptomyces rectiverticillatus]QLE72873.1 MarR family transcriptional regulator [Streptomyces rectiverticillatus]
MAAPGYGKRTAPDQAPRSRDDFARLPAREASIASHIDRLPDGAAVDIKTLAKELPAYGQQAVASALKALAAAGHLRRIRRVAGEGRTQWVSRWFFSRTPRDDAWWEAFLENAEGKPALPTTPATTPATTTDAAATAPPQAPPRPESSPAYIALATLGCSDPRLILSAAECTALEPLAAEWLARGVTPQAFARILSNGLPGVIHCPGAFTRKRLIDRLPPEPPPAPAPAPSREPESPSREPESAPPPRWIMECADCGIPGRPEALPGGLCRTCRGVEPPPDGQDPEDVRARVSLLRAMSAQAARGAPPSTGRR